jgi:hypothetical protein
MVVAPKSARVRDGLLREDLFVCVHEQFMTETAAMADIVLPATTFLEHDDIYPASGHTFLQVARGDRAAPGDCRSNHAVICGLAGRLGAEHPGFGMSALGVHRRDLPPPACPDSDAIAGADWLDCALPFERHAFPRTASPRGRRFHFRRRLGGAGAATSRACRRCPDHAALIDRRRRASVPHGHRAGAHDFLNTSFTETPTSPQRERRPTALIHPGDCAASGSPPAIRCASATSSGSAGHPCRAVRRPAARRGRRREHLAQRRLRGRAWASTPWSAPTPHPPPAGPCSTTPRSGCAHGDLVRLDVLEQSTEQLIGPVEIGAIGFRHEEARRRQFTNPDFAHRDHVERGFGGHGFSARRQSDKQQQAPCDDGRGPGHGIHKGFSFRGDRAMRRYASWPKE